MVGNIGRIGLSPPPRLRLQVLGEGSEACFAHLGPILGVWWTNRHFRIIEPRKVNDVSGNAAFVGHWVDVSRVPHI